MFSFWYGIGIGILLSVVASATLMEDLHEFTEIVSFSDLATPFEDAYGNDTAFVLAVDFLISREFETLIETLVESPIYENFSQLVELNGLPMTLLVTKARQALKEPPFPKARIVEETHRSLSPDIMPYIYEMEGYILWKDVWILYRTRAKNSRIFQGFLAFLTSPEFRYALDLVLESPEWQDLNFALLSHGTDVAAAGFLAFLTSPEFRYALDLVLESPEWQDLNFALLSHGTDVAAAVSYLLEKHPNH
ncbi:hypothetical protein B566_EDAN003930 [Ephemera danica]|nr:hypothetical protein B566_EDAN003930 [Ephemera danica]